jgi:hypothetical protein
MNPERANLNTTEGNLEMAATFLQRAKETATSHLHRKEIVDAIDLVKRATAKIKSKIASERPK